MFLKFLPALIFCDPLISTFGCGISKLVSVPVCYALEFLSLVFLNILFLTFCHLKLNFILYN